MNALEKLYEEVGEHDFVKAEKIKEEVDYSEQTVIQALGKLTNRGALEKDYVNNSCLYYQNADFDGSFKYNEEPEEVVDESVVGYLDDLCEELRSVKSELYQLKQEVRSQ